MTSVGSPQPTSATNPFDENATGVAALLQSVLYVNPKFYGAAFDGVTDDTAAINAALAVPGAHAVLLYDTPRITGTLVIDQDGVSLVSGMYKRQCRVLCAPAAGPYVALAIGKSTASVIYENAVIGIGFYSLDTTLQKTAIRATDFSELLIEDVKVGPEGQWTTAGAKTSVGLHTRGREALRCVRAGIDADTPILIDVNPNNANIDCDHFHFEDEYIVANGNPCITVSDGVDLSNLLFDGDGVWAKGTHGFFYNDTTSVNLNGQVKFSGTRRWEQSESTTGFGIYFARALQVQRNVVIEGFQTGSGNTCRGIYLRTVSRADIKDTEFRGIGGSLALDVDVRELTLDNWIAQGGSTVQMNGMVQVVAWGADPDGTQPSRPFEYWQQGTNTQNPYSLMLYGMRHYREQGVVTNGAANRIAIPLGGGAQTAAIIHAFAHGATKDEGGTVLVTSTGAFLVAGTANFGVGNVAGKLTVFWENAATITLCNQLGENVSYGYTLEWR